MVGWSMSAAMTAQLVTDALVMAIWRRGKPDALLHPLHGSVVPHVAGSAHRADDAVVGHQPLELLAGVLAAAVGVNEKSSSPDCSSCGDDRRACDGSGHASQGASASSGRLL